MATFGTTVAAAAWPVLKAVGGLTEVTISTVIGSTIDDITGQMSTTTAAETVDAKVSPFRADEVDGVRVTVADKKVLVPKDALTTVPTVRTTVTIDGEAWTLQAPPELTSNDGLWLLHIRRIGDV